MPDTQTLDKSDWAYNFTLAKSQFTSNRTWALTTAEPRSPTKLDATREGGQLLLILLCIQRTEFVSTCCQQHDYTVGRMGRPVVICVSIKIEWKRTILHRRKLQICFGFGRAEWTLERFLRNSASNSRWWGIPYTNTWSISLYVYSSWNTLHPVE